MLWILGGYDGNALLNDSWISTDGNTWTQKWSSGLEDPEAAFGTGVSGHAAVVMDDMLWVIGGTTATDT